MFQFTYDAWNRLVKVTKAYRDPDDSYNLKADMVVNTIEYDALHRRTVKAVKNSAGLDCTYHYYYNGQQIVETHNGSEQVIQQFVWGQTYIDELVQVGLNDDPADATEDDVETFRYAMHNANFNVQGLVDDNGAMVERYEYTPYGERQVYISAGLNDPDCYAPIKKSKRVQVAGVDQPWGINPVGHQGLFHDEETQLVNNRRRILHPRMNRFIQRDPIGYSDGLNEYAYLRSNPLIWIDSTGTSSKKPPEYQPDLPPIIPPGDPVQIIVGTIPCGTVQLSNFQNCSANITWHGMCIGEIIAYALVVKESLCKYLQEQAAAIRGQAIRFDCEGGKRCCNKAVFNGSHHVNVSIREYKLSWTCSVSAEVSGNINIVGEIGSCVGD